MFRHYAFLGAESLWAAQATECANEQGRFWEYYDKLFAEQAGENSGAFSRENLKRFADDLGLNTSQFNQCLDAERYSELIEQETLAGQQRGVRGTPAVFVNGQLIDQGADYEVLRAAIETALTQEELR